MRRYVMDNGVEELFKQLDLSIYMMPPVYWWQQPVLQFLAAVGLVAFVVLVIVLMRRRTVREEKTPIQPVLDLLYQSASLWQEGTVSCHEVLLTLTALVKHYTGLVMHNRLVLAMTDQEWLSYSTSVTQFAVAQHECFQLGHRLSACKFRGTDIGQDQMEELFELVYQIIAKTSSGRVALTSGLFKNTSKRART